MKPGNECGYCEAILYAHCNVFKDGEEFCKLREEYYTDPNMTTDDVYDRLEQMVQSPEQAMRAIQWVEYRAAAGLPPVPIDDSQRLYNDHEPPTGGGANIS